MKIRPVILSGGSGTRLWPVSRQRYPKQFAPLMDDDTLFAKTVRSVLVGDDFLPPMIVGNAEHSFFIQDALDDEGADNAIVLLEPKGRNTAAAALVAALAEMDEAEDVLHLVMPSDHIIADRGQFYASVRQAAKAALDGHFVLFGIRPTAPETGYGYIVPGKDLPVKGVQSIGLFREKPDTDTAQSLIQDGALWNSGIFLYAPATLCREAETLAPEHLRLCRDALEHAKTRMGHRVLSADAYDSLGNHPFDTLIMEKTERGAVMPCSVVWSDVGSWQALWQIKGKDKSGNALSGPVALVDSHDCYIRSDGLTVAVVGVDNLAVVATKDAVLVAPRERSQDVKALVAAMEKDHAAVTLEHTHVRRPWGSYESIAQGDGYQVKHIMVKPGQALSLQMHHHRAEHWVVVAGTAKVECDDTEQMVFPNQSVFVPQGAKHRLTNPGKVDLHLIEVQSGDYLGEDDIIRFEDKYHRIG